VRDAKRGASAWSNVQQAQIKSDGPKKWNLQVLAAAGAGAAGLALCVPQPSRTEASSGASQLPPFGLDNSKFDKSTFWGRTNGMFELIDPRNLLVTEADITKAKALLDGFKKNGEKPQAGVTEEQLWEAKNIIDINVHPVTGEILFAPGRMSAFVPMNVPLCAFMIMAKGTPQIIMSQYLNQTYNAVNNYVNRSGDTVDMMALAQSYGLAVFASISIAMTGSKIVSSVKALSALGPFVPYIAVALAGSANVGFTRMDEWNGKGVPISSEDGTDLGYSLLAGKAAVTQTVLTRSCLLPIAPMILPGLVVKFLGITSFGAAAVVELSIITVAFGCMLPMVLAVLPQKMQLETKDLEPEFQNKHDKKGQLITKIYANKGL